MQQLINVWSALDTRRRMTVILATVAMFAAVLFLSRMAAAPSMTLLYAGLESGPAGEVVRSLEQRGVIYEVRGGAIFVESGQRDELRMTLASEGLPTQSSQGYELLDGLSGFGTTSQMFDAAYWRAKEGELARTIVSSPHISNARVHLANAGSNPFQRDVRQTASVSVTASGGPISASHARALKYLVASAVAGLSPEDVSVIDGSGALIGAAEDAAPQNVGEDRAEMLRERVQRLLEARVGFGNAVVEVSVDTVTESESISEHRFDPESRVAISTDTEERSNTSKDQGGGDVTVASNLPEGDGAGTDSSQSQNSETRERVNYEVSETRREIVRQPGAVKRLTLAVLVNGTKGTDDAGAEVFIPRPDAELDALRELVSAAVGFDPERGDVITMKSMEFEPLVPAGTESSVSFLDKMNLDIMSIIQMAVLAIVALILGLFVIKPVLSREAEGASAALPPPSDADEGAMSPLTGEIDDGDFEIPSLATMSEFDDGGLPDLGDFGGGGMSNDDPVTRLRNMIGERQEETVEILRSWLEDKEENA
ncbi:flagellar basal-body MS-ring/collar protein FliF [Litorivita sp. NS0012-18]|uniref:flagellar basal-body MS-ring/collar protein FliF n=1 Tax=Litorivita sp. NS0012-18 TaxID=3127655 RepID=UPI00310C37FF